MSRAPNIFVTNTKKKLDGSVCEVYATLVALETDDAFV